jgi:hypothetical protein
MRSIDLTMRYAEPSTRWLTRSAWTTIVAPNTRIATNTPTPNGRKLGSDDSPAVDTSSNTDASIQTAQTPTASSISSAGMLMLSTKRFWAAGLTSSVRRRFLTALATIDNPEWVE